MFGQSKNEQMKYELSQDQKTLIFLFVVQALKRTVFQRVDDLGLKAVIEIIRETPEENNRCNNRMESKYDAIGTIEGYTSTRKRKIYVSEIKRQVVGFYVCDVHNDDLDVLNSLPLWKEFNEYEAEKRIICDEHIKTLITHYKKAYSESNVT